MKSQYCANCEKRFRREDAAAFWIVYGPERREFLKRRSALRHSADGVMVCPTQDCCQMSLEMLR